MVLQANLSQNWRLFLSITINLNFWKSSLRYYFNALLSKTHSSGRSCSKKLLPGQWKYRCIVQYNLDGLFLVSSTAYLVAILSAILPWGIYCKYLISNISPWISLNAWNIGLPVPCSLIGIKLAWNVISWSSPSFSDVTPLRTRWKLWFLQRKMNKCIKGKKLAYPETIGIHWPIAK